ncbi:unnamed protein product, partial [Staurois parvus]
LPKRAPSGEHLALSVITEQIQLLVIGSTFPTLSQASALIISSAAQQCHPLVLSSDTHQCPAVTSSSAAQ